MEPELPDLAGPRRGRNAPALARPLDNPAFHAAAGLASPVHHYPRVGGDGQRPNLNQEEPAMAKKTGAKRKTKIEDLEVKDVDTADTGVVWAERPPNSAADASMASARGAVS